MSSGSRTLFGGSLKLLQDLSSGSNIPALEPLVNVAVRIYTAAEGARNNKKRANELAEDVGNSVKQILQVYPKESNSVAGCTPDLYDEGIGKFQRTLENAVAVLEKIGGRRWISRVLNQQHDAEELVESRARINEAKLEFLVTIQMAKDRTRQREHQYPMFQQADLDVEQMWNSTSRSYTRAIARLVPRGKEVVVRQYNNKSSFIQDIENLIPLRHPNLPFVGASALTAPRPFILMEPVHTSARDVIRGLFYESQTVFQRKAIQIIAGVLEGINHLRENEFALLHLKEQVSSIQYDGYKVILNIDLPRRKSRTEPGPIHCSSPIFPRTTVRAEDILGRLNNLDICRILEFAEEILDIHEVENHVLEGVFLLPSDPCPGTLPPDIPSALRPIWDYCMGRESEDRLYDLRSITEQLYRDQVLDVSQALVATGNMPYRDFALEEITSTVELGSVVCPTKLDGLVVLGNILTELREKGIIDMNQFVSTEVDEDFGPTREGPWPKSIPAGSGIFPEWVGDYVRYECSGDGWHDIAVGRTTTISLHHDTNDDIFSDERWPLCLHCRIWGYPNTEPSTLNAIRSGGIYFHALPDTIGAIEITERDQWGIWTTMLEFEGREEVVRLEPSQKFSYTHE